MDAVAVPHRLSVSARALGPAGSRWLEDLPGVLAGLATDWSIIYGRPFDGGNAAYVIEAVTADARPVILKVDGAAIWQWAFIERVSTGLFLVRLGHRREAEAYLAVADRLPGQRCSSP